jgi:hypothetical protein
MGHRTPKGVQRREEVAVYKHSTPNGVKRPKHTKHKAQNTKHMLQFSRRTTLAATATSSASSTGLGTCMW